MKLKVILLIGLSIILMGCMTTSKPQMVKPTKPKLIILRHTDGGICLDKENATKLGTYILELENAR